MPGRDGEGLAVVKLPKVVLYLRGGGVENFLQPGADVFCPFFAQGLFLFVGRLGVKAARGPGMIPRVCRAGDGLEQEVERGLDFAEGKGAVFVSGNLQGRKG